MQQTVEQRSLSVPRWASPCLSLYSSLIKHKILHVGRQKTKKRNMTATNKVRDLAPPGTKKSSHLKEAHPNTTQPSPISCNKRRPVPPHLTCRVRVTKEWSRSPELVQKRPRASNVGGRYVPVTPQNPVVVERAVFAVFPVVVRALVPSHRSVTTAAGSSSWSGSSSRIFFSLSHLSTTTGLIFYSCLSVLYLPCRNRLLLLLLLIVQSARRGSERGGGGSALAYVTYV